MLSVAMSLPHPGSANTKIADSVISEPSFSPSEFRKFMIMDIKKLTHNVKRFIIALPNENARMGMTVSSCIMVRGVSKDGKEAVQPYTPISLDEEKGYFMLCIKNYPTGNVSSYMHNLKVGDYVEVKGPFKKLEYTPNMKKRIGLIAGGAGLTPCLQVIRYILKNPQDTTEVHLLFANRTPEDIILKHDLDQLAKDHKNFRVTYVVNHIPPEYNEPLDMWGGHINADIIRATMPSPASNHLVYVCGPPGMMKEISGDKVNKEQGPLAGLLADIGYSSDMVYKF